MVKTLPSNAGGAGSILGWGVKIPHALRPKNQNIKNRSITVTNSVKMLKKKKILVRTDCGAYKDCILIMSASVTPRKL